MKIERISLPVIGDGAGVVDLAPGLTVVEAPSGGASDAVEMLIGALCTAEDGVHVELALDDGTGLVAFRPAGAAHRMINLDSGDDLSASHGRVGGGIDVLGPWRQAGSPLERDLLVTGSELVDSDPVDDWVTQLAAIEPDHLLATAEAEVDAEQGLRRATAAARAASENTSDPVRAHTFDSGQRLAVAVRRHRRLRRTTFAIGPMVPVATLIGLNTVGTAGGVGLLAGTLAVAAGCFVAERRLQGIIDTEEAAERTARRVRAGTTAGGDGDGDDASRAERAPNGLAAHADGPTGLTTGTATAAASEPPKALAAAAERYQAAAATWQRLVGAIPASWALANRDRIRATAQLRVAVPAEGEGPGMTVGAGGRPSLAAALTNRAAANRVRAGGESLPLFMAEPLTGLSWDEKAPVLEFVGHLAAHQQLVLVTADAEVLSWARLEEMTESVGVVVVPPTGQPAAARDDDEGAASSPSARA